MGVAKDRGSRGDPKTDTHAAAAHIVGVAVGLGQSGRDGDGAARGNRHLNTPRQVALSRAALEVLAVVAYRQPVRRAGIELIRGAASDSALDTLLERGLVERNAHQLLVTTRAFLDYAGLRDLGDLPSPGADDATGGNAGA